MELELELELPLMLPLFFACNAVALVGIDVARFAPVAVVDVHIRESFTRHGLHGTRLVVGGVL